MEFFECLHSRRSIRRYERREIPEDMMNQLLQAAMAAPSAGNEQAWQFLILTRRELLDSIPNFHPYAVMVKEAPAAILVCGDLSAEKHEGFWVQDCSAATMSILLAANAIGLGSVWVGLYPRTERTAGMKQLLQLPEHIVPFALLPLGFPATKAIKVDRFATDKIHRNGW